jgi:hypothetical protein
MLRPGAYQCASIKRFAWGEGPGSALLAVSINARSNLEPFKLALVKTELEGRVDRRLLSRV